MDKLNSYDILIGLIVGCQSNEDFIVGPKSHPCKMIGSRYLLGQSVRQFIVPEHHKCVSEAAQLKWEALKVEYPIFNYWPNNPVYYRNTEPIKIKKFNGAHGNPYVEEEVFLGDNKGRFQFKSVFHIEHIITINSIVDDLIKIDLNQDSSTIYDEISQILDKVYVCYMLKEEDRSLNKYGKIKRPNKLEDVINGPYREAGIEIDEWN